MNKNSIVSERNPQPAELTSFLLGFDETKKSFRSDALKGRRAVVFGALWHSIGSACAAMLAEFGCELVVVQGESENAVRPTFEYLQKFESTKCEMIVSDLSLPGSGKETAELIESKFPGIDLCLYISGLSLYYPYTAPDTEAAQRLFQVNLFSMAEVFGVFLSNHLIRKEKNSTARLDLGGCSSVQALISALDNAGFYSASKASVEQYLRGLAVQYANQNVRTHCIAPGCVDTARHRSTDDEFIATRGIGVQTPWGEIAPPTVIAESYLASICAPNYRVGDLLVVDGGWSTSGRVDASGQSKS